MQLQERITSSGVQLSFVFKLSTKSAAAEDFTSSLFSAKTPTFTDTGWFQKYGKRGALPLGPAPSAEQNASYGQEIVVLAEKT